MATQPITLTQGTDFYDPNTGQNLGTVQYDPNTGQKLNAGGTAQYNYANTSSPSVNASNIGATPYQVPPAPVNQSAAQELASFQAQLGQQTAQAQAGVTSTENQRNQLTQDYQILANQLTNETADRVSAEDQQGLPQLGKDLQDLTNLSRSQTAKYLQGITQSETAGGLASNVNAQQSFLNRQNAIDSMLTNSLISAKQGDIGFAQNQVDRAISLKYDPIKQQIENKKAFLDLNYQDLSRADQKLADAKSKEWDLQLKQVEIKRQQEQDIQSIALEAAKLGASQDVLSSISKSKDILSAISAANSTLANSNNEIVRLDNGSTVLVNKITGKVIKNLGGVTPTSITGITNGTGNGNQFVLTNSAIQQQFGGDIVSAISNVMNSSGAKSNTQLNAAINVITGAQSLANNNPDGTFKGLNPVRLTPDFLKSQEKIQNLSDVEAINLKVQQWASGAALTEAQTKQVAKITPKKGDTDNVVRAKLNSLTDYMLSQVKGELSSQGIDFSAPRVDYFSKQATTNPEETLTKYYSNPQYKSVIESAIKKFPNYNAEEILQIIGL